MEKPKIQQQFEDIKRDLGTMSADDWTAIPDVTNMTRTKKNKVDLVVSIIIADFYCQQGSCWS